MDFHLTDKVFIVTGGARGIGKAIAKGLVDEGAHCMIVDRSSESVKTIPESGQRAHFYQVDLTSATACKEVIDDIVSEFGRIDGIINNAGNNDGIGLQNG